MKLSISVLVRFCVLIQRANTTNYVREMSVGYNPLWSITASMRNCRRLHRRNFNTPYILYNVLVLRSHAPKWTCWVFVFVRGRKRFMSEGDGGRLKLESYWVQESHKPFLWQLLQLWCLLEFCISLSCLYLSLKFKYLKLPSCQNTMGLKGQALLKSEGDVNPPRSFWCDLYKLILKVPHLWLSHSMFCIPEFTATPVLQLAVFVETCGFVYIAL